MTGNHCAPTQPGSRLLAELVEPVVRSTATYLQDSVSAIRALRTLEVLESDLVITYDVVKLYPTIHHGLCKQNFAASLRSYGFAYSAFASAMLAIVLSENYCTFADVIRRQIEGFATGAACASQVAHLHLEEMLAPIFELVADCLRFHRRYIDDGICILRCTRQRAEDLFAQINRLHPSLEVTFEISYFKAIFLDLRFFKGPGWRETGILDHEVYQKPVNRYLYLPFRSETPRNTLQGMIIGELIRFITHSTSYLAFLRIAKLFWFRLRARGYPHAFLQRAFASAPDYQERARLLVPRTGPSDDRIFALILTYSYAKARLNLSEIIHRHKELLPQRLRTATFIQAWRAPKSLGRTLIPYTFTNNETSLPPDPAPL